MKRFRCPECGFTSLWNRFCPRDGIRLKVGEVSKPCHRCGNPLFLTTGAFCTGCGLPHGEAISTKWTLRARLRAFLLVG